ncbi:MAG: zinc ribbon domain-containing protein [Deltaproteobacteria bacterium]|jgi:putative FmdB family regulatory protein
MPIYEYRCRSCGEISEIFQGVGEKDDPLRCQSCNSTDVEKILSPSSFSFKAGDSEGTGARCCDSGVSCANPKRCCEN